MNAEGQAVANLPLVRPKVCRPCNRRSRSTRPTFGAASHSFMHMKRITLPALAALAGLGACTIPTDAPVTDVRWVVPSQTTTIAVTSFLPAGVGVVADG